jgi:hypothetical protein
MRDCVDLNSFVDMVVRGASVMFVEIHMIENSQFLEMRKFSSMRKKESI